MGGAKPRVEIMADDAGAVLAREHTKLKKALLAAQQAVERLETTESVSVSVARIANERHWSSSICIPLVGRRDADNLSTPP